MPRKRKLPNGNEVESDLITEQSNSSGKASKVSLATPLEVVVEAECKPNVENMYQGKCLDENVGCPNEASTDNNNVSQKRDTRSASLCRLEPVSIRALYAAIVYL